MLVSDLIYFLQENLSGLWSAERYAYRFTKISNSAGIDRNDLFENLLKQITVVNTVKTSFGMMIF